MRRIAIMGLGLMGGSLGLALKRRGGQTSIAGYARRAEVRSAALEGGVVDEVFSDPAAAVVEAELVVFCVPVLTIPGLVEACRTQLRPGAIVTDVASTKSELVQMVETVLERSDAAFVGSHPMAGSDETGLQAADKELYDGATVIVTVRDAAQAKCGAVAGVAEFWRSVGGNVVLLSPEEHDRVIARTSHLPHIVAAALVNTVLREELDETARLCGSGFMDTTRIAAGSELMWHDIIKTNSATITRELELFEDGISRVRSMIEDGDFDSVRNFLAQSRNQRRNAEGGGG